MRRVLLLLPLLLCGILTYLKEFVNYRHPDPRRGEPRVCSTQLDAFPEDPLGPLDPDQTSERLILKHPSLSFGTFGRKMGTHFDIFHYSSGA